MMKSKIVLEKQLKNLQTYTWIFCFFNTYLLFHISRSLSDITYLILCNFMLGRVHIVNWYASHVYVIFVVSISIGYETSHDFQRLPHNISTAIDVTSYLRRLNVESTQGERYIPLKRQGTTLKTGYGSSCYYGLVLLLWELHGIHCWVWLTGVESLWRVCRL